MAAKGYVQTDEQCRQIVEDVRNGRFRPVYLLQGEEPYYVEMVCNAIIKYAFEDDSERDFNQIICYGADVKVDDVISSARRYPMFAERSLVVVKQAQMLKNIENLSIYCEHPLESTVLVIALYGSTLDGRKAACKTIAKNAVVVNSPKLRDYEMPGWISMFYQSKGLKITPDAAALMAEFAGTDMAKIAVETDKMLKNLKDGTTEVTAADVECNVGISREFSVFELTKELSARNAARALKLAFYIGSAAKFSMPPTVSAMYTHFSKVLRYIAYGMSHPGASDAEKAKELGIAPFFIRDYSLAARNYPLKSCMNVIALLREYDYKGKGGDGGDMKPEELLTELVAKILNS